MAFTLNTSMTILTGYPSVAMDRSIEFLNRDMEYASFALFLMALDTILRRICPGSINRKKCDQPHKIKKKTLHKTILITFIIC
jgi:hypothetical protein